MCPFTQRTKKSLGRLRIDCRPNKYFSCQCWPMLILGKSILFVLYLTLTSYFLFLSFKACALTAQSNQNIRMKMGVADIRLVHSIVVKIMDESLI